MFDDPRKQLKHMEEELRKEEPDLQGFLSEDPAHALYEDEAALEDRAILVPKRGKGGWVFLILLVLSLAATARWWMQWL